MHMAFCDHHAMIRDGLRQVLRGCSSDITVIEASSSAESFDVLSGDISFDMVLLEPGMPGMGPLDGLDAVRRRTGAQVVVLSGIEDRATIRAILGRGVAGYIPKRLGLEAIGSALRLVMAGETFIPSLLFDAPEAAPHGPAALLTIREREVLALLRDGYSNKSIALHLNLSEVTIKTHLSSTFRKLGVQNRVQAARMAP